MLVKICGLMNREDVDAAVKSGADYVGFIFAESKRKISFEQAAHISKDVPPSVLKVGVFVNPTLDEIQQAVETVKLDLIQLHGEETPDFCDSMPRPVIKAFSIRDQSDIVSMQLYQVKHILADAPGADYRGGSGHTFDWSILKQTDQQFILAGGLTPENVSKAISETSPIGVDVSSGVETNLQKDHSKIHAFIKEAKRSC
ncbi:phosphoribosylanthranilate isomerase [Jeotgalibacillus salarius]|uniref:N-(5'-phosphoribosyl)anthranilate isomerase n=1 Tax=Jeotgalibacillus salarius TaxID=546023 RepID=A0A4Y8LLX9_9BACL|nr:phosphoribosylanthranilate isomerase [Jeotgalibacillus salarius]TFE02983.1 phosphoribosylanthranilate isomerase [Jeotgalibacillus salarius]